ncbi:MAG: hypothetical protein A2408_03240 [Candidatus Yonathbacteria bacterium RIFOXYC1_FULL_52_10]|uniref:Fibronectin type-III domain-containing protein n=1 Tax=Candidatus Yonathbacteria bacterium RIFOXYD1_FULL_52_36 TaxID=1802730 RepID=A0A1G2SLR3_9BACT|nr:MAG: hypothetical protein A2408_03240 [Candidatus Yonathbacteria bacterium RIFOXYC1_FULL_52_10]OHA85957.1 MAG: hypothetical protein A2591_00110 [Candidatus Yonathbacteria bacterium RIFOXYD1_FULL_52_36]
MKKIIKSVGAVFLSLAVFFPQGAFAASLNNDPQDFATLRAANYTQNPGSTTSWSSSTSASAGQVVALSVYYHNTTDPTAQNVRIKLSPRTTGNGTTHSFTATVSADNASSVHGNASVTLSSSQTLTFIPGRVYWYPNQQGSVTSLPQGQTGEELFTTGVNIGNIECGWATQGSLVVHFLVGNASSGGTLSVTTNAATNIDTYSATLNGHLTTDTNNTQRWFEWGTSSSLGSETTHTSQYSSGAFSKYLSGLAPNTTYHYRAVAQNSAGTMAYGSIMSFTTTGGSYNQLPSVTTNPATNILENSATLRGYLTTNSTSDVTRWFEWGTSYSLGNQTTRFNQSYDGEFSSSVSGLAPNTTYYFRAAAQNSAGTVYGSVLSFTTTGGGANQAPGVTTKPATNISENYATLNGYVNPNVSYGGYSYNTTRWFEWGTSYSLGNQTTRITQGSYAGDFSETISGLQPNTTYYFRAAAQNSYGTAYGSTLSFTTGSGYGQGTTPTAITNLATTVTQTSGKLNGLALITGNISTNAWFEWGVTSGLLGNTTPSRYIGTQSSIAFSETITGLAPNTTYYFRAVAQNSYGTSRGSVLSFTTSGQTVIYQPPVIVQEPPRVITIREPQVIVRTVGTGVTSPIEISIIGLREQVFVNDCITYVIRYENKGNVRLTDSVLRVMLPQEMQYLGSSRGSFSTKENILTVVLGELLPGATGEVTVEACVLPDTAIGKVLVTSVVLVYTDTRTNTQGDAIAYAIHTVTDGRANALSASLIGLGFFPDTVIEWFILLILILIIVFLIVSIQNSRRRIYEERRHSQTIQ